jgi:hypothetical protein
LHDEIRQILNTKLFLIDGVEMPDSYRNYLMHSVMQNVQHKLSQEDNINTSSVKGAEWDDQFPTDVKAGLDKAMYHYDGIIQELERSAGAGDLDAPTDSGYE